MTSASIQSQGNKSLQRVTASFTLATHRSLSRAMPASAQDLNLSVLDVLVKEYVDDVNSRRSECAGNDSAELLAAAHDVRTQLLSGNTKAVLDQESKSAEALANSQIFKECRGSLLLARQHLIELLRSGQDKEALVYLQQHIAPLADDPSSSIAQADIQQMAEMLLYDGSTSPPANFWPTRSVVANRMAAYLRLESGAKVPRLLLIVICMALMEGRMFGWRLPEARKETSATAVHEADEIRPLQCVIHPILRVRLPPDATTTNDTEAADEGTLQAPPQPQEEEGEDSGAPGWQDRSAGVLAEFAGVLVSDAEAALAASGSELGPALQQQLLRVPVREEVLLEMVYEYCKLRGLPAPPDPTSSDSTRGDHSQELLGLGVYERCDDVPSTSRGAVPSTRELLASHIAPPSEGAVLPRADDPHSLRGWDQVQGMEAEDAAEDSALPRPRDTSAMQSAVQTNMQAALEAMGLLEDSTEPFSLPFHTPAVPPVGSTAWPGNQVMPLPHSFAPGAIAARARRGTAEELPGASYEPSSTAPGASAARATGVVAEELPGASDGPSSTDPPGASRSDVASAAAAVVRAVTEVHGRQPASTRAARGAVVSEGAQGAGLVSGSQSSALLEADVAVEQAYTASADALAALVHGGNLLDHPTSPPVDLVEALDTLPGEIPSGRSAWEVVRRHLRRSAAGGAAEFDLEDAHGPVQQAASEEEQAGARPGATYVTFVDPDPTPAHPPAILGPPAMDASMQDQQAPEATEASAPVVPAAHSRQLTPRKLAAQREWLQQLKESVTSLDLASITRLLDRATTHNGNVVDGYASSSSTATDRITPEGPAPMHAAESHDFDSTRVDLEVPPELEFKLRRLCLLKALNNGDLSAAQRVAASVLGPLTEAHPSLQPMLQRTMQCFLQTDTDAIQTMLQSEKSSAALSLSSQFSVLCSLAKRAAPDDAPGPAPPQLLARRSSANADSSGAAASASTLTGTTADLLGGAQAQPAADSRAAVSAAIEEEASGSEAARWSQLVGLLQAGVFLYASWIQRRPSARRRAAASEPCGAVLGIHSLLHGGIDAAVSVMQALDVGDRGSGGGSEWPGGAGAVATRSRALPQHWGRIADNRGPQDRNQQQHRRLHWLGPSSGFIDRFLGLHAAHGPAPDAVIPPDGEPPEEPPPNAAAGTSSRSEGPQAQDAYAAVANSVESRLLRTWMLREVAGSLPNPLGAGIAQQAQAAARGAFYARARNAAGGAGGSGGSATAFLAASEFSAARERQIERASFRAQMLNRQWGQPTGRAREPRSRMQDYIDLHAYAILGEPTTGGTDASAAAAYGRTHELDGAAAAALQDALAGDASPLSPMDTDDSDLRPSDQVGRAAAPGGAQVQPRGAAGGSGGGRYGVVPSQGAGGVGVGAAAHPPPPPPPERPVAVEQGDGMEAEGEEMAGPGGDQEEEEEGEQFDLEESVERLVEITNLPAQYARSVLIAHGGDLAASVAMVMDG